MAGRPGRPGAGYAFGDGAAAAERLAVLADVFDQPSRALLAGLFTGPAPTPRTIVDLGCGPGHTTALLAEVFPGARVLGLDQSAGFLATAAAYGVVGRAFARADVSRGLPAGPVDLLYARFLLSHLPDPERVLSRWAAHLADGGVLVVEEAERILTEDPAFARYLSIVTDLVANRGATLLAGPRLAAMPAPPQTTRLVDRVTELRVRTDQAARMFALNLASWRHDRALDGRQAVLDALGRSLAARLDDAGTGLITWQLRQVVLARR